jgi:hypothetical protein
MLNIVIILLIIILFFAINKENFLGINFNDDNYKNDSLEISQDSKLSNDYNIENDFNCYLYGCNSSRNDIIEWIGSDNFNNPIFTDKTNYFIFNNGFLNKIDNITENKIIKNNNTISIPVLNNDNKIKLKVNLKYKDYNFIGYLTNNFYHIQYLLYEKLINNNIENNKLYEYVTIKIIDNEYKVIHKLPIRSKIEYMETIWIDYGPIMLGPLLFTTKLN